MKQLKFIIFGSPNKNTLDLVAEIKSRKHLVSVVPLRDIVFEFTKNKFKAVWNGQNLIKSDIFIFRGYNIHLKEAQILAENLLDQGKVVLDEALGTKYISSKLYEASRFAKLKINHPKTFQTFSTDSYKLLAEKLKFPIIAKPVRGMKGRGIEKINTPNEFLKFFAKNPGDYLIQDFFKIKSDLRIFVVDNQVLGGFRRFIPENEFRSNAIPRTRAEKIIPTSAMKKIAIAATKALGYDIAGVDLFEFKNKLYVIEANSCPQWQKFKTVTGINPAKAIIDLAVAKHEKQS